MKDVFKKGVRNATCFKVLPQNLPRGTEQLKGQSLCTVYASGFGPSTSQL